MSIGSPAGATLSISQTAAMQPAGRPAKWISRSSSVSAALVGGKFGSQSGSFAAQQSTRHDWGRSPEQAISACSGACVNGQLRSQSKLIETGLRHPVATLTVLVSRGCAEQTLSDHFVKVPSDPG